MRPFRPWTSAGPFQGVRGLVSSGLGLYDRPHLAMRHAMLLLAFVPALAGAAPSSAAPVSAVALAVVQDEEPKGPTKEEVANAVKLLKAGLAKQEAAERIAALDASAQVVHPDVVKAITAALADTSTDVRDYTLDLLGRIDDPSALAALHAYAKKHRRTLPEDPEHYILVLKSAARHADTSTIELLTDKFFEVEHHMLIRARILCLANIRDKLAVDALFDQMTRGDRARISPHVAEFQLAFNVLLGIDVGANQDRWMRWWSENKKSYTLPEAMPKLPDAALVTWQQFWGLERTYTRNKKRGDRGQDPERDGGK
jgi:hypothetical protein